MTDFITGTLCEDAYRKVGIVAQDDAMTADQLTAGIRALNYMIDAWTAQEYLPTVSDAVDTDSIITVPDAWAEAVMYGLAVRLAENHGASVPQIESRAEQAFRRADEGYRDGSVYWFTEEDGYLNGSD
jgi:hypothetical protein